ncbi:PQQ-dependent sugar dehydrogenase, partial [Methylorubrum populi]|nr:PQQ-dependent sugar dehydrogenase [Methylorubrum populi]
MADVTFSQSTLAGYSGLASALQWGPDGRLYVAERFGSIKALTVAQNGNGYVVTKTESIDLILNLPNHNDDGTLNASLKERQVTGILATGTAANPVLYVTSSDPRIGAGNGGEDTNLDTNSSIISRLTFDSASQSWKKVDLVRGLPRSEENHSANGMAISPDGKTLYVAVGGNTNAGAPSNNFAGLPEFAYSAAVLKVDLTALDAMSIKDPNGLNPYVYDLPTLDDPNRPNNGTPGNENPDGSDVSGPFGGRDGLNMAKITAGSPVQVYSPGYRNAYDVLLTSDGKMFT